MSLQPTLELMPKVVPAKPVGFDVSRLRKDFPILQQSIHGKPLVYLDNAASTQKPRQVIGAIKDYYEKDHANVHRGVHELSERATKAFEEARLKVQKFLGAGCLREVIFTRGTTEAVNLLAHSFSKAHVHPGDEIIISALEHHSNIVPWQMACHEKRANLRVIPVSDAGELDLGAFEKMLGPQTKMVAVSHVSNALGTVNPIERIIELAHRKGVPVFLDGAQAAGHFRIDVRALDVDFYAFSGHKVFGPTGIGVLYGKARHLELMPPYQYGGDMIQYVSFEKTSWNELPYKFEAGTPNIADAVGLGVALDYLEALDRDQLQRHERQLLQRATQRLEQIPGVRIVGTAQEKVGVVAFVVQDMAPVDVGAKLDLEGIAVRTGHHCCQPLMEQFGLTGTVRASFALYNTLEEVDQFADVLATIAQSATPRQQNHQPLTDVRYPSPAGASPDAVAEEFAEFFDFVEDWTEKYQHIIELGEKLPAMPEVMKTEVNRVKGCQSTVYLNLRTQPGSRSVVEFLVDSDADIVRGLAAMLERLFSGQKASAIADFDVQGYFRRLGLDSNLSMGRRNGLAEMADRVQHFARQVMENEK